MRQPGYLNPKIKEVLIYVVIILIPTILGVVLSLVFNKWIILESVYLIWGCVLVLVALFNSRRRDGKNLKKNRTIVEDKNTKEYKEYRNFQIRLYILGAICAVLSLISFLIFSNIYI